MGLYYDPMVDPRETSGDPRSTHGIPMADPRVTRPIFQYFKNVDDPW